MKDKRDYTLDALKGWGCLLMILAHIPLLEIPFGQAFSRMTLQHKILSSYNHFGGLAPVIFFAVTGVTATLQAKKSSFFSLFSFYTLFGLMGISYNALFRPFWTQEMVSDIPQIIALAAIVVILIEKYIRPDKKLYLLLSIAVFGIHSLFTKQIPSFPMKQFLFAEGIFPLIPWLMMFFAGIFAYNIKNIINLVAALTSALMFLLLYAVKFDLDSLNKWNMSVGYFLISFFILFLSFYLFRLKKKYSPSNPLVYIGQNSLLFLYLQAFLLYTVFMNMMKMKNFYLYFVAVFAVSYPLIFLLKFTGKYTDRIFKNPVTWVILLTAILGVPLISKDPVQITLIEAILGIIFANHYHNLSWYIKNTEKRLRVKKTDNKVVNVRF